MASLVQDVWLGATPRLRGRRLAPYEDARVRIVFQPDLGATLDDLVDLLASAPRRWPDVLPVIVAGHGLGGTLALAAAGKATAAAALAPSLGGFLGAVELARQLQFVRVPLLALIPRGDAASAPVAQILEGVESAALLAVPGDGRGLLRSPWVQLLAEWARHPPAAPP